MADGDGRVNDGRGSNGCLGCLLAGLLMMTLSVTVLLLSLLVPARRLYSKCVQRYLSRKFFFFRLFLCFPFSL